MEKLMMRTTDVVDENVEKICKLFPNVITEYSEDGVLHKGIDFDALKQELSHDIVDGNQERYQFTWPDKKSQ